MSDARPPKKVVLAYSGGLDTSIILKWLQTEYGAEVVTFTLFSRPNAISWEAIALAKRGVEATTKDLGLIVSLSLLATLTKPSPASTRAFTTASNPPIAN